MAYYLEKFLVLCVCLMCLLRLEAHCDKHWMYLLISLRRMAAAMHIPGKWWVDFFLNLTLLSAFLASFAVNTEVRSLRSTGQILSSSPMHSEKENSSILSMGRRRKRGELERLHIRAHSSRRMSAHFPISSLLSS